MKPRDLLMADDLVMTRLEILFVSFGLESRRSGSQALCLATTCPINMFLKSSSNSTCSLLFCSFVKEK